jgi:hypothetical protein
MNNRERNMKTKGLIAVVVGLLAIFLLETLAVLAWA